MRSQEKSQILKTPSNLLIYSFIYGLILFSCSIVRHKLYQSNVYDLGLFDQWLWLISNGYEPISSMAQTHVLADHAAWAIYLIAPFYKIFASVNWLFFFQSFSLAFTSIPLWKLSTLKGLSKKNSWIIILLWWFQPVVFNINLFDFHPEVIAMPILALSFLFISENRFYAWLISLILVIGFRDGLIIIVFGIALENLIRKKFKYALSAFLLSLNWLLFIKFFLFPYLGNFSSGESPTVSNLSRLLVFITQPINSFSKVDYLGGLIYLLLISIAFIPFWKKNSFTTLLGITPLVLINFIAFSPPFRTLIHQYNLPIALIGSISVIEGISKSRFFNLNFYRIFWIALCWFALAKPYFFLGPYLSRVDSISQINKLIKNFSSNKSILTTSYIAPHLSHRKNIFYPRSNSGKKDIIKNIDIILLKPDDPGYDSSTEIQEDIINLAKSRKWNCKELEKNLNLCTNNKN
tara:strand:+ start:187 stop:1575 length:1389 start_codon:yes stop_codon:yes gene_type:complete